MKLKSDTRALTHTNTMSDQGSLHSVPMDGSDARREPESLESLYEDLPSDATALKAVVGTMRIEASKKDAVIARLQEELDDVKASHSVVLQRSAEWQDELETLRLRVPQLDEELRAEKQAREAEADRVKDLRMRAEESRRAIMRLQGEQSDARAKAKADNRRSWVPSATTPTPVFRDEQEQAELKKSKRASLAFGPNSLNLNAIARAGAGHRRTQSGSRSISGGSKGDEDVEEPLSPTTATGLRGLRLSGIGNPNGTSSLLVPGPSGEDSGSAPNSRRSSFRSDSGKSPTPAESIPDTADMSTSLGARLAPPSTSAPRSSHIASPAMSQSALSSVGVGSPILEDNEEEEVPKSLPALPPRAIGDSAQDRELKLREVEIERLTREVQQLRTSRQEAIDARQASEDCLNALRDFISSHDAAHDDSPGPWGNDGDEAMQRASIGAGLLKGVKLPPLPTDDMDDATEAETHARSNSVAPKGFATGWGVKLPNFARKSTSSSAGLTPTDENGGAAPSGESLSPATYAAPLNKSIANGFAGFGNLLTRVSPSAEMPTPPAVGSTSPRPPASDDPASGFKSFGWFKRASVMNGSSPQPPDSNATVEEKLLSPPFRSLDHDQLAIAHQTLSPETEKDFHSMQQGIPPSVSIPSRQSSSSFDTAGSRAARLDELTAENDAQKVADSIRLSEPELSYRAQKAAEKTSQVEHLTGVLPAFD